jgi:predicted peptidase
VELKMQVKKEFEKDIVKRVKLGYLLYLPEGYGDEPGKKWPLVLFLHGAGERGSDIERVKVHGIPKLAEAGQSFPFIAVSPQCPENTGWGAQTEELKSFIDEIMATYAVDDSRVYVTGLSMGGFGTFALASEYPGLFAAIAPICGGGDLSKAERLKDIPAWVFHGAKDNVVPLERSKEMVDAIEACGGNVKFTVYPDADHDSWTVTYNNPEFYEWLLSNKRMG